jgi:hypothetical protein
MAPAYIPQVPVPFTAYAAIPNEAKNEKSRLKDEKNKRQKGEQPKR